MFKVSLHLFHLLTLIFQLFSVPLYVSVSYEENIKPFYISAGKL